MTTAFKCDRCGTLDDSTSKFTVVIAEAGEELVGRLICEFLREVENRPGSDLTAIDLCDRCHSEIESVLKEWWYAK